MGKQGPEAGIVKRVFERRVSRAVLLAALGLAFVVSGALAAGTLRVDDTGHLRLLHASGSALQEEGPVTGTLPGSVTVRLVVGTEVTATFTIHARGGSIAGHGTATLHSSGRYSSFGGTLAVGGGTGRYAHAHGGGGLYGVIERRTDTLTVQTTGTLSY